MRRLDVTSEACHQRVIICMRADPEPKHLIPSSDSNGTPSETNAHGVDGLRRMNGLESKAWMIGIFSPKAIGDTGTLLDFSRKVTIRLPERVSGP